MMSSESSRLLCIGSYPDSLLPTALTVLACGAVSPLGSADALDVFRILPKSDAEDAVLSVAKDYSACPFFFKSAFAVSSWVPVMPELRDLVSDAQTEALLSALRGKGMPLSFRTDREAVEWAFSLLLGQPDRPASAPFFSWLSGLQALMARGQEIRLTVLADPADAFSAGIAFALLHHLRTLAAGSPLFVSLVLVSPPASRLPESAASLRATLESLRVRSPGDALWLLSLPSSAAETDSADQIVAFAVAEVISEIHAREALPSPGFHGKETDGTLTFRSLGDHAAPFAAFLSSALLLLTDVLPALRDYLKHPGAGLRAISRSSRRSLCRALLAGEPGPDRAEQTVSALDRALKTFLTRLLFFLRSLPFSLRLSAETANLWQEAVAACGRYITVAAEYDTTTAEVHETGLDAVRPVHRDTLDDTDEEQLLRRLEDMKKQLDDESAARDRAFSVLGGLRALQVRLDCLTRCRAALADTEEKLSAPREDTERLTLLKRERRVRLLSAAISRCESELAPEAVRASVARLSSKPPEADADPYAGVILSEETCHFLEGLLSRPDPARPDHVPLLFPDSPSFTLKSLQKQLTASVSPEEARGLTLTDYFSRVYACCLAAVSSLEFPSRGEMPALPLLPDLLPLSPPASVEDLLVLLPPPRTPESDRSELRGLLSMLLLRQYRRRAAEEAALTVTPCTPDASPVLRFWLASRGADQVSVLSLSSPEGAACPFALFLPGRGILPAWRGQDHAKLIPSFVTWYDADTDTFADPVSHLSDADSRLLAERLRSFLAALGEEADPVLMSFLRDFLGDLSAGSVPVPDQNQLKTRLLAVCGLLPLPAYEPVLSARTTVYEHALSLDPVGACLTGDPGFPAASCADFTGEVCYCWKDIPFARSHPRFLLDSTHAAQEAYVLSRLAEECAALSGASDDYQDALSRELKGILDRCPDAQPECRSLALSLLDKANKPITGRDPSFTWPWDPLSPAMRTILHESLGDQLAALALDPFSDLLAVAPARGEEILGDSILSAMCLLPAADPPSAPAADPAGDPEPDAAPAPASVPVSVPGSVPGSVPMEAAPAPAVQPDAVLPPLSAAFARALCTLEEGKTLLRPGFLRFERLSGGAFRVSLVLDGAFPVRLVRRYAEEEVVRLYAHDIPTVAVWPSVPFRPEEWHAYFVYAHLSEGFSLSVLPEGGSFADLPSVSPGRFSACYESFPLCISLMKGDQTLGAVPNLLPHPDLTPADPTVVCLDFGSSAASVVCSSSGRRRPLQGPPMIRALLVNPASSRDLLRREFLPAVPVSALLPTVSRIFRNAPGTPPVPFVDGIILMSSSLEDLLSTPSDAVYTSLKWEEEKGRSNFLCLHQVLLMAALQARSEGAASLSFRFSLPDEMAREGREKLMNLFLSLSEKVLRESGFPFQPEGLPVLFSSESAALGSYFRYCAPEDTRGGFMVLDLGSCTADISLFLRGRPQAVRTCQIPLGVHYMFLPSLLRDPEMILREFGAWPEDSFRRDLLLLTQALSAARTDPAALRRARVALDFFLSDHLPALISAMSQMISQGVPTRFGALLLLHFSYLMMLSGLVLLQLAADPSRNDFLPEQMTLCIAGRGAVLMEALPPALKKSLWHFLTMFRNKRVAALSLLFSSEKKMEIPVGLSMLEEVYAALPPAASVPASIAVRPEELLPEFLLRFLREFPFSAQLLFPGFYTGDYYHPFSPLGESLIESSIAQSFPPAETPRPYDSLSAWIGNLLDLLS